MWIIKHQGITFRITKITSKYVFFVSSENANVGAERKKEEYRRQLMTNAKGEQCFRFRNYIIYLKNIIEIPDNL